MREILLICSLLKWYWLSKAGGWTPGRPEASSAQQTPPPPSAEVPGQPDSQSRAAKLGDSGMLRMRSLVLPWPRVCPPSLVRSMLSTECKFGASHVWSRLLDQEKPQHLPHRHPDTASVLPTHCASRREVHRSRFAEKLFLAEILEAPFPA